MQLVFLISGFEEGRGFKETTQVHLHAIGEQLAKKVKIEQEKVAPGYPDHITQCYFLNTPSRKHCHGETEAGDLSGGWGNDFTENKVEGDQWRGSSGSRDRTGRGGLCTCPGRWGCLR